MCVCVFSFFFLINTKINVKIESLFQMFGTSIFQFTFRFHLLYLNLLRFKNFLFFNKVI